MRFRSRETCAFAILTFFLALTPIYAQQSPSSPAVVDLQALAVLKEAIVAMHANTPVNDVSLSGSAHRIAGSDDEVGTVVLKALGTGASRMDLNLSSGQLNEVRNVMGAIPSGNWTGPDGTTHPMVFHNLLTEPSWFFPLFAISRGLAPAGYAATYVGHEIRGDAAVEHLTISQTFSALPSNQSGLQRLSQIDIYFDSATFLPRAIAFNIHPDDDELVDIPIEVLYANYQTVNGFQVPFRVQKFLNNCLVLDLQFQSVILNSGVTAS